MKLWSFKWVVLSLALIVLVGCARGQIKQERTSLQAGAVSKTETILVKPFEASQMRVTGDKADEAARVHQEKVFLNQGLSEQLISDLKKKGFNAKRYSPSEKGAVLEGSVPLFEHGSGAARALVGMGAGSSNLHLAVKLHRGNTTLADFDVVATSGGRGGLISTGSFIDAHISDASEKIVEYLEKSIQ